MDLGTRYLGLTLRNSIIASASPLAADVDSIRQLEDSGAGAVVLPSLFEEQIRRDEQLADMLTRVGADSSPEAGSYFPAAIEYNTGPDGYLDVVTRARSAVDIPVIASLNGTTEAGWVDYARLIEQAGATALELNIYRIAAGPSVTGGDADADCVALLKAVRDRVRLPVSVKLHPYFSAFELIRDMGTEGDARLVTMTGIDVADSRSLAAGAKVLSVRRRGAAIAP